MVAAAVGPVRAVRVMVAGAVAVGGVREVVRAVSVRWASRYRRS